MVRNFLMVVATGSVLGMGASAQAATIYDATDILGGVDGWSELFDNTGDQDFTDNGGVLEYSTLANPGGRIMQLAPIFGGQDSYSVTVSANVDAAQNGNDGFQVWMGNGASGGLFAISADGLVNNGIVVQSGVDNTSGFNTYTFFFDDSDGLFDIAYNGSVIATDVTGAGNTNDRLLIGDGQSSAQSGNVAMSQIVIDLAATNVPEPSSLALLGLGGLLAFRRRRA